MTSAWLTPERQAAIAVICLLLLCAETVAFSVYAAFSALPTAAGPVQSGPVAIPGDPAGGGLFR